MAITICVESGQISTGKEVQISTPVPFAIETRAPQGWKLAMVMPDAGGSRVAVVLDSKKSLEYPFWPPVGELRLSMRYWTGARPQMDCAHPPNDSRRIKPVVVQLWGVLE